MTISIVWKVDKIECQVGHYGIDRFISKIWYSVTATGTDGEISATGATEGFASIQPIGDEFSQLDDLTEAQVVSWLWDNGVDRVSAETEVTRQVNEKLYPAVIIIDSPWA
jgi:hypothetical protein